MNQPATQPDPFLKFRSKRATDAYVQLAQDWYECTRCPLHTHRSSIVHLRGSAPAHILFIGEAPGRSEDTVGRPFVGDAGKILGGLKRDPPGLIEATLDQRPNLTWAVANIVACMPEQEVYINQTTSMWQLRQPTKDEALVCEPRLNQIILSVVRPRLVILLGKVAKKYFTPNPGLPALEVYHPAYILRRGGVASLEFKKTVLQISQFLQENLQ